MLLASSFGFFVASLNPYATPATTTTPDQAYPWYRPYRRCACAHNCAIVGADSPAGRGANGRFARATSADDGAECTASNSADVRGIEGKSVVAEARADDGVSAPGGGDARSRMRREGNPRRRDRRNGESAA